MNIPLFQNNTCMQFNFFQESIITHIQCISINNFIPVPLTEFRPHPVTEFDLEVEK